MTPLTLRDIRATIIDATPDMMAALLRDLDWMIDAGLDVEGPASAECDAWCTSDCHDDDCEHHTRTARRAAIAVEIASAIVARTRFEIGTGGDR